MSLPPEQRVTSCVPLGVLLSLVLFSGCSAFDSGNDTSQNSDRLTAPFEPNVNLLADVNRDGVVDAEDEAGEDAWTADRGAIFLANIDDDQELCAFSMSSSILSDDALAACNDARDSEVNGDEDLLDLARLRVERWADAPGYAVGSISVTGPASDKVRLFKQIDGEFVSFRIANVLPLSAKNLREGVNIAIEANDIARDPAEWDGYADVVLSIYHVDRPQERFQDTVRLRVAPVVMFHHLTPVRNVYVSRLDIEDSSRFRGDLGRALAESGEPTAFSEFAVEDLWAQDYFEPAYMSMPRLEGGGAQHVIQVNYRSANVNWGATKAPLREAGRIVYWLRGRNQAAVQQYQTGMSSESQTLNSLGNTEVIPPYEKDGVKYPLGRLLRGRGPDSEPDFQPDPSFTKMLEAQAVQPPVYLDTSWLAVAHVDETLSFLPADTPRGWIALVADPAQARRMLQNAQAQGHGEAKLFTGMRWPYDRPAEATVSELLNHAGVMDANARAALEIDEQLLILREATGLTDDEIVRVPFLFQNAPNGATALQPGTVNLLSVSRSLVIAPDPHGLVIDGKDIFKVQLEEALAPHGIRVHWTDTWDLYHLGGGEVHCATNSAREVPSTKWWESGR
ncbi:protein-arginine deiminase [Myxococcus sp. CA033]|uniref:protein-arginine deiminase family protein n=1 Tax=Myxococcus sp. CA033 TaxID=2741516 RepID=UPI00157B3685|nr:protein-arginine deiminase family protein [Myxococcus sp. CA033]NTX34106.1 protein-arginine deiminase [Myxococcus sp. CA033]